MTEGFEKSALNFNTLISGAGNLLSKGKQYASTAMPLLKSKAQNVNSFINAYAGKAGNKMGDLIKNVDFKGAVNNVANNKWQIANLGLLGAGAGAISGFNTGKIDNPLPDVASTGLGAGLGAAAGGTLYKAVSGATRNPLLKGLAGAAAGLATIGGGALGHKKISPALYGNTPMYTGTEINKTASFLPSIGKDFGNSTGFFDRMNKAYSAGITSGALKDSISGIGNTTINSYVGGKYKGILNQLMSTFGGSAGKTFSKLNSGKWHGRLQDLANAAGSMYDIRY